MVGIICPPPIGIGLTDLPNIGGASGPPGHPGSGTTAKHYVEGEQKKSTLGQISKYA